MKTSAFLALLRTHATLHVVFRTGDDTIAAHYHLTEVKRVTYETMDCGAMTHRWSETQFELWVPALADANAGRDHMPAGKFLAILDRVEKALPLDGDTVARVFVALGNAPAALYDIAATSVHNGQLHVELTADRTRCKAAERRAAASACCGAGAPAESACCSTAAAASTTACCA